jgi:transposase-like protein
MKMSFGDGVHHVAVLVAIGVDDDGFREVLGVCQGGKEDEESRLSFLRHLKERGLTDPELCVSDACLGLREALGEVFPRAQWQRCIVHFYRNVSTQVPHTNVREVMAMMKAIHAQENRTEAKKKAAFVVERLQQMKLKNAALLVVDGIDDTLSYYGFPPEHWRRIRTNNPLERIIREVRRRTQVVGSFPDGHAALMLVAARLRHVSGSKWGTRRYLDMDLLRHHLQEAS